jgi:hypothetical protein
MPVDLAGAHVTMRRWLLDGTIFVPHSSRLVVKERRRVCGIARFEDEITSS